MHQNQWVEVAMVSSEGEGEWELGSMGHSSNEEPLGRDIASHLWVMGNKRSGIFFEVK